MEKNPLKNTNEMEQEIKDKIDLENFLIKNQDSFAAQNMADLFAEMIRTKKMSKAELARRARTSEMYLYQVLSGKRIPTRDRFLCFCISLGYDAEETRSLLKRGRYADLYARDRRDAIILFGLDKHWDLAKINDTLFEKGEKLLAK